MWVMLRCIEGVLYDGNRVYNFLNRRTVLFRILQAACTGLFFVISLPIAIPSEFSSVYL